MDAGVATGTISDSIAMGSLLSLLLDRGGVVVVILLLLSVLAAAIALVKLYQLARGRVWSRSWVEPLLRQARSGDTLDALAVAEAEPSPVARVCALALRERIRGDLPEEALKEEVERAGGVELAALETNLRGLETIGTLAPLLGLLGTVLGMIRAFMRLESGGSSVDPALLSGGIWEALLTTAVGLCVAIPALAMLSWLDSQVERVRRHMDDVGTQLLNATRPDRRRAAADPSPADPRAEAATAEASRAL